jgi:hypothetical protein
LRCMGRPRATVLYMGHGMTVLASNTECVYTRPKIFGVYVQNELPVEKPMREKEFRPFISMATFLVGLAFPALANAEWTTLPPSFSLWSSTHGADVIRVLVSTTPSNPSGCADNDSYMVRTTLTQEVKSRIYASLLLAKAMGKPAQVWVNGCESARPAIETVVVE